MLDAYSHDFSQGKTCFSCGRSWTEQENNPVMCENVLERVIENTDYKEPVEEKVSIPQEEEIKGLTSIIVVGYLTNYPLFHYTGNCLGSIREHTDLPYEIIYIDNGSPIKMEPKDITADKIIVNKENIGVAKAWNQGIRVATGEYIVLLNNDAMVFDNWLEDFQESLDKVDLVMATPMYGSPFARASEALQRRAIWENEPIEVSFDDFADFSCVGFKQQTVRDLHRLEEAQGFPTVDNGLFDEQFYLYCEDVDVRKRLERVGMTCKSTRRVNTFHIVHATGNMMPNDAEIMNESKRKFEEKWNPTQNTAS